MHIFILKYSVPDKGNFHVNDIQTTNNEKAFFIFNNNQNFNIMENIFD